ncbi:hypothetical protein [Paenibacillus chitinolyticus]
MSYDPKPYSLRCHARETEPDSTAVVSVCGHAKCRSPIYQGEKRWVYDEEWFCTAVCLASYMGAVKKVVKPDSDS